MEIGKNGPGTKGTAININTITQNSSNLDLLVGHGEDPKA